jgi:hypothetical protein
MNGGSTKGNDGGALLLLPLRLNSDAPAIVCDRRQKTEAG